MATGDDLLQAILANPNEDAPRLLYAEWLERQGDLQRAEFIRTQIEFARLSADDERRSVLIACERQLLVANSGLWCDDWMLGHRFRRGFLDAIRCYGPGHFLENADRVFRAEPVREVWFDTQEEVWDPDATAALAASPYLSRVQKLNLPPGRCFDIPSDALLTLTGSPQLSHLETLELGDGMGRSDIDDDTFCELIGTRRRRMPPCFRALRRLGLSGVPIGDDSLAALTASPLADTLTHLDLSANERVTRAGVLSLVSSPLWSRLIELDVSGVHPHTLGRALVVEALGRSQLRRLAMHADPETLSGADSWGPLESLRLRCRSRIDINQLRALAACKHLAGLTRLDLKGAGITAEGASLLAACPYLTRLTALNLEGSGRLGDDGVKALAASPFLKHLKYLNLAESGLTDAGVIALARSPLVAGLRTLDLSMTEIGDAGLRALADSPHLGKLTTLILENPCISSVRDGTNYVSFGASKSITEVGLLALIDSPRLPCLTYLGLADGQYPEVNWHSLVDRPRIFWPGISWQSLRTDEQRVAHKARFGWFDGSENLDAAERFIP
jgi:uncharacterized protein (TIGR02996 family)